MLSPKPQPALITTSSRLPVTGLALNTTAAASTRTSCWISTARHLPLPDRPCPRRYARERAVRPEAQHRTTASATASTPTTFRYVSYWPAKERVAPSSSTADDRTATPGSATLHLL